MKMISKYSVGLGLASWALSFGATQVRASTDFRVNVEPVPVPAAAEEFFSHRQETFSAALNPSAFEGIGDIGDIEGWLKLGKEIWDIISGMAGQLVIAPMAGVGVIPQAAGTDFSNMQGWKLGAPTAYLMTIDGLVAQAFSFTYTISYDYNGSYLGKGQFLANVGVLPADASCGLSWKCGASLTVGTPINVGTAQSPIAAIPLSLSVSLVGHINSVSVSDHFLVQGDGTLVRVGVQNSAPVDPITGKPVGGDSD